jgi:hypothetical protein
MGIESKLSSMKFRENMLGSWKEMAKLMGTILQPQQSTQLQACNGWTTYQHV